MKKKQLGLSMPGVLALMVLAIMILRAAISLIPMYWDDVMVGSILDTIQETKAISSKTSTSDAKRLLEKRFQSNNLPISTDQLEIDRSERRLVLTFTYERRDDFLSNIDFVLTFTHRKDFTQ
jgi:hypothetical protein